MLINNNVLRVGLDRISPVMHDAVVRTRIVNPINNAIKKRNRKIIHISHTDLDGYGCNYVLKMYLKSTGNSIPIRYHNTSTFGAKLPLVVADTVDRHYRYDNSPVLVLITDISRFNIAESEFVTRTVKRNHPEADIMYVIIDHHMNNEYTDSISYSEDEKYVQYNRTKFCATYNFADILNDGIGNLYDLYRHHIEEINNYDTGNWGNWNINNGPIADSIRYNAMLGVLLDKNANNYNTVRHEFIKYMILDGSGIMHDTVAKIKNINSKYESWKNELKLLTDLNTSFYGVTLKYPDEYATLRYGVCDGNNIRNYTGMLSLFSKEYLNSPECAYDVILSPTRTNYTGDNGETVKVQIDMRTEKFDVAKLALINGGGGHVKAAGATFYK